MTHAYKPGNSRISSTPTPRAYNRSCSCTACGSYQAAGAPGAPYSNNKVMRTLAPGWPNDPDTVEEAKQDPEVFAHKHIKQVTDYYIDAISQLKIKPVIVGHSFGGLIAQRLAGEGVAAVTVAIDPAPFRGVLPLPLSALKSASAVLGNPLNYTRAVPADLRAVPLLLCQCGGRERGTRVVSEVLGARFGSADLPGGHRQPEPRGRKRRLTPVIQSGGHC